jgi:hypothetical protein
MARWEPTHTIIKNFAFGDPAKQYKKGTSTRLSGDCLDFAALNHCALLIKPESASITEKVEKVFSSVGEGSDV